MIQSQLDYSKFKFSLCRRCCGIDNKNSTTKNKYNNNIDQFRNRIIIIIITLLLHNIISRGPLVDVVLSSGDNLKRRAIVSIPTVSFKESSMFNTSSVKHSFVVRKYFNLIHNFVPLLFPLSVLKHRNAFFLHSFAFWCCE